VARAGQKRAALSRDAAVLQREVAATSVVRDVVSRYWELAYAAAGRDIQQQSLELAREQLRITRIAIAQKVAARTEALAIEQAIAVREQEVLLAEVDISNKSLALRRLVGMEIGPGEVSLAVADAPDARARQFDLDATLALARDRNPRLAVVRLLADTAALDVDVAADATRARLDAAASVGPDASSTEVSETLKQIGLLQSFSASASLTYRQSLGKRATRGAYRKTLQAALRAKVDIAAMERDIAVEVVQAVNLVRTATKRIEVSDLAIQLAESNLDNEKILVEAGDSRAFDVLQRQDELAKARLSRERAVVDYLIAIAGVESLTGELLGRYGVAATSDR
jgi:outer membrane protein TolC